MDTDELIKHADARCVSTHKQHYVINETEGRR